MQQQQQQQADCADTPFVGCLFFKAEKQTTRRGSDEASSCPCYFCALHPPPPASQSQQKHVIVSKQLCIEILFPPSALLFLNCGWRASPCHPVALSHLVLFSFFSVVWMAIFPFSLAHRGSCQTSAGSAQLGDGPLLFPSPLLHSPPLPSPGSVGQPLGREGGWGEMQGPLSGLETDVVVPISMRLTNPSTQNNLSRPSSSGPGATKR